jgi:hypothetical protein
MRRYFLATVKQLFFAFPIAHLFGCAGVVVGSLISISLWIRVMNRQPWSETVVGPIDEPLVQLIIGCATRPWTFGFELSWFVTGDSPGIVALLMGAIAMGLFYAALGFVSDLCTKAIRVIVQLFGRRTSTSIRQ